MVSFLLSTTSRSDNFTFTYEEAQSIVRHCSLDSVVVTSIHKELKFRYFHCHSVQQCK
jgi:hypothetical protein